MLWFDDDHDGFSQRSELRPLQALGVLAIEVEPYALGTEYDEHGNYPRYLGSATSTLTIASTTVDPIPVGTCVPSATTRGRRPAA